MMERAVLLLVPRDNGCHSHSHISRDSPCSATDYNNGIWLVVVLHNDMLASIAKPGDSPWTPILRRSSHDNNFTYLVDVTYSTRLRSLLFIDSDMKLFICDLGDIEHPQVLRPYAKGGKNWMEKPSMRSIKFYFVESGGETLIITRYIMPRSRVDYYKDFKIEDYGEFKGYLTFNFRVHKIKSHSNNLKEIHDLGKVALFVGANATISVCSTEVGCETNCIYYCDDYRAPPTNGFRGHDMGIFKMNDRTIRPFYDGHRSNSSYCTPFWFCPSL
ncbi:uncharacterized protein LOC141653873 [Silene latifolia]|uniref:uncharacterized protein LOC141653873 n=1 Tax=Silene latifolia TaxID=37657 RepID=UPI003D787706